MPLDPLEEIGLKVIALVRDGQLSAFQCSLCDDSLMLDRSCESDSGLDKSVYSHPLLGEFKSCPLKFISNSVYSFLDEYDYYEKYPSAAPKFGDVVPRFWESVKFYENFRSSLDEDSKDIKKPKADTSENMSKMAALFPGLNKG